ncbi:phage antirepressor KilAC domain-containing protein [Lactobacillus nasalidis]|uniref:Phage antirepressor KilAC domain-containing protein n=1 Tax=Lactobacillus nasalidis TaxID=2797258 RepID=A0ABQ3W434_9LACO|nr:phage antirepressor [Lactobacillus nasalidis]GHV98542.1 phage antirepressor KilAC domain-containing protein [Lactobacillus nasalidis]GHV99951.1 phage antirepressor KilAC domain-containing protein [Lactobacillus nasalidis]GHW01248.1 phage antirepressor KilAC domain-containing protein [Lactobacillus nasalidis]
MEIFKFEGADVRVAESNDQVWFVGKDVAKVLGYKDTVNALKAHVDEEDKKGGWQITTPSGTQPMTVINESGLYSLVLSSKLPTAKKFKHWVTNEVLPAIRKHGAYMTGEKIEEILSDPDTIIKLATELKAEREGRLIAEQRVNELTPKASYYDLVLKNESLVTITQIAKDYGMSGREMNNKLHELKVQYKQGSTWLLYSKYQKTGWTHSDTIVVDRTDGTKKAVMQTKWTQKGRLGLYELLKSNGVLPLIEQEELDF